MNSYIIIHKSSDRKITLRYDPVFRMLREIILSEARWTEEEIHTVLKTANSLRTENHFILRMDMPDPGFDFLAIPKDLSFKAFWDTYAHKIGKIPLAQRAWEKLSNEEKIDALLYIPRFRSLKRVDNTALPYPSTYLNGKYWQADKI